MWVLACALLLAAAPQCSAELREVDADSFNETVVHDPAVWILEFFSPR
jgi:hypothetical protein